jgi:hypothetical protein
MTVTVRATLATYDCNRVGYAFPRNTHEVTEASPDVRLYVLLCLGPRASKMYEQVPLRPQQLLYSAVWPIEHAFHENDGPIPADDLCHSCDYKVLNTFDINLDEIDLLAQASKIERRGINQELRRSIGSFSAQLSCTRHVVARHRQFRRTDLVRDRLLNRPAPVFHGVDLEIMPQPRKHPRDWLKGSNRRPRVSGTRNKRVSARIRADVHDTPRRLGETIETTKRLRLPGGQSAPMKRLTDPLSRDGGVQESLTPR